VKKIINKLLVNHSLIYKLFLYIATIVLVVYLFPKGGQFKYEFQKGKPWQYENYYAPFDFAIQKSDNEIEAEKQQIIENSKHFFEFDEEKVTAVKKEIEQKTAALFKNYELSEQDVFTLNQKITAIINQIYEFGYLDPSSEQKIEKPFVILRTGNEIQEIQEIHGMTSMCMSTHQATR